MAFASNSAAFGIKSSAPANTTLFGGPKAAGSLFGTAPQQQQPAGGLFSQGTQQQPAGGGLFGQNTQQQQQQPASTGLFNQPAQQPASTGLFSLGNQQQQQPGSTGLFGQPQQQQQQPAGTGLFGAPQQQQQQPASNFFNQSTFQQPQQQPQQSLFGPSIFGQPQNQTQPQQQQPNAPAGLFSSQQPQQQQQQPQQQQQQSTLGGWGGLGTSTNTPALQSQPTLPALGGSTAGSGLGSSLFGPPKLQMSQVSPQQSQSAPFTKSTKYNDLPDVMKNAFENIESHIQGRIQISNNLKQRDLGEEATKGQEQIRAIHKDLVNAISTLRTDVLHTRDLKTKVDQSVQDTIVATRIVDGFRNPQANGVHLKSHAGFPSEFFTRITEEMRERLQWYKATLEQIERKLAAISAQAQYTPQSISATLEAQNATFMSLANKTAALHAELQKIKVVYTQLWRAKTGSVRDPFEGRGAAVSTDELRLGMQGMDMK